MTSPWFVALTTFLQRCDCGCSPGASPPLGCYILHSTLSTPKQSHTPHFKKKTRTLSTRVYRRNRRRPRLSMGSPLKSEHGKTTRRKLSENEKEKGLEMRKKRTRWKLKTRRGGPKAMRMATLVSSFERRYSCALNSWYHFRTTSATSS